MLRGSIEGVFNSSTSTELFLYFAAKIFDSEWQIGSRSFYPFWESTSQSARGKNAERHN